MPAPKLSKAFGILSTDFTMVWIENEYSVIPKKKKKLSNSALKRWSKPRAPGLLPPVVDKAEQFQQQNSYYFH